MESDLIHAVIKHRNSDGEVTDTLKIPKEEYEKILSKFSTSNHTFLKYTSPLECVKKGVVIPLENAIVNWGCVDSDGFVKALYLMNSLTQRIIAAMTEHKSFQLVVDYKEEALKTNFYFYAPGDKT